MATVRAATGAETIQTAAHFVSPEYFDVLRIPLRAGRVFGRTAEPQEAVINDSLARHLWPGVDPLGRRSPTRRLVHPRRPQWNDA